MKFKNKKILFISANFFKYENLIVKELEKSHAQVDFFNERPSNSLLTKGIIRIAPGVMKISIKHYYKNILQQIKNKKYDYLLLIKGESIPFFFLEEFSKQNPNAFKIFYMYDSIYEYPKSVKLFPYFDKNITFELQDAKKYNIEFRPLFYIDDYLKTNSSANNTYDLTFIGSAHTDRFIVGEKIRKKLKELNLKGFFFYYAPSKFSFMLRKFFDKHLKDFDLEKLNFNSLTHQEISDIYAKSTAVLDINKPFQFGLSMRCLETLAAEKKLITTNSEIKNYSFFREENILVINRENPIIDKGFFTTQFKPYNQKEFQLFSLNEWINDIFKEERNKISTFCDDY